MTYIYIPLYIYIKEYINLAIQPTSNHGRRDLVRKVKNPKITVAEIQQGDGRKFYQVNYHCSPPPFWAFMAE